METNELSVPESQIVSFQPKEFDTFRIYDKDIMQVLSITKDGRILWRQREVETDDDLRDAMKEVFKALTKGWP